MKEVRKHFGIWLWAMVVVVLWCVGCDTRIVYIDDEDDVEEAWVNFEKQADGTVWFYTNKQSLVGVNGNTFWKIGRVFKEPMEEYEVEVSKKSGSVCGGYGVVFAAKDVNRFLVVMIDTMGSYKVGRYEDGVFSVIKDWTKSTKLTSGYLANVIKIKFMEPNQYEIYFNGDKEWSFEAGVKGGYFGYLAVVDGREDFPEVPVDVSYRQVNPTDIGM